MADHVLYYSQSQGLTDSAGRKLSEASIPRLRPGEIKTFELNLLDYSFADGDMCYVAGDTDCKDATSLKIVGTSIAINAASKVTFTLGTTQDYADLWNAIVNPNGILVLWIQLQVTKPDGRIHKLIFQLRGAPSVDGTAEPLLDPDYVTSDQLAQAIASSISTHNSSETAHADIRQLIAQGGGVTQEAVNQTVSTHNSSNAAHDDLRQAVAAKVSSSAVGAAGGVCGLNESGLVSASNLPSYVDDIIEAANVAALPTTGEAGKIYIALDTLYQYRWGGSSYVELPRGGVALGETSETAHRGDRGNAAWLHSQATGNPHGLTLSSLGGIPGVSVSTDNALVRFDGITGHVVQNSNVIIDDLGNISIAGTDTSGTDGLLMNPSAKTSGNFLKAQIAGGSTLFSVDYTGKITAATTITSGTGGFMCTSGTSAVQLLPYNNGNSSAGSTGLVAIYLGTGSATNIRTGGTNIWAKVFAKYNQASGTAENSDFEVDRTETAIGSGAQYSQTWAVGGVRHSTMSKTGLLNLGVGVNKVVNEKTGTGLKVWYGAEADLPGTLDNGTIYLTPVA